MRSVRLALLLGSLLLSAGVLRGDEDCVEGEDGCDAPPAPALPKPDAQNNIYILTDENFGDIVKKEELIMATFYAPW